MSGTWIAPPDWGSAVLTSADMDTYVSDNENYLKTHIALEAASALTIAAGVITVTQGYHKVAGEGAADDEIDTIGGGTEGDVIFIRPDGDVLTLKDAIDNLLLGCDIVLPTDSYFIALICDSAGNWHPLGGKFQRYKTILTCDFGYPAPGTDWTPATAGALLDSSLSTKSCYLRIPLEIGESIISYKLVGDAVEVAALTLDCKLTRVNKANPITTTDIAGGAITQITADGNFDSEAVLTDPEVAATDKQYTLIITGTTSALDSITVMGAEILILH